ncbi:MAG TPA: dienelactone hydrolase family protein [Tepidisphaeraceae bacterium]|nr:dienelactone hydrolase family protein [Tepidisphaeraceae bacterium]
MATAGPPPERAKATLVLIHGRGGSAEDMLPLHRMFALDGLAAVAPQAANHTWYPHSFLSPMEANQPYLDSALRRISAVIDDLVGRGVSSERIAILGFSQGACLTTEFVARNPRRYGAVLGLSGGLIGPPGPPRNYVGSLDDSPVFLGCNDPDPHIPFERVRETEAVLRRMGATVELRRYPGPDHSINEDELEACRALLERLMS